jgi:hypothetical protein
MALYVKGKFYPTIIHITFLNLQIYNMVMERTQESKCLKGTTSIDVIPHRRRGEEVGDIAPHMALAVWCVLSGRNHILLTPVRYAPSVGQLESCVYGASLD